MIKFRIFIFLLFCTNILFAQTSPSPTGYWKMDETTGTVLSDASGNGHSVTLNNNSGAFVTGKLGGAIQFDGSRDGIETGSSIKPASITIAAYIKVPSLVTDWIWIAAHGDNVGLYVTSNGNIQLYYYDGSNWTGTIGSINVRDDQWHHVAGTFDDVTKQINIYIDGQLDNSGSHSGSISYVKGADFHIGSMNASRNFVGVIDELKIFDKALSQSEIGELIIPTVYYTLVTNATNGSVSPSEGTYEAGTVETLTAYGDSGYAFDYWSGDLSGSDNPASIIMDSNKNVTANFREAVTYKLTINIVGQGSVSPPGGAFEEGSTLIISALASSGYIFDGWSGDLTGTDNPDTITMNSDMTITASFVEGLATYYVSPSGDDGNLGTKSQPFASISKGYSVLKPGEICYVMPGDYYSTVFLNSNNGTEGNLIKILAYDLTNRPVIHGGLRINDVSYMHLKGFVVTEAMMEMKGVNSHHNIIEFIEIHHIENSQQAFGITDYAHDNLILNCDSHDNVLLSGSNCDGIVLWAPDPDSPNGPYNNTIRFCRSYFNNDDGFDTWSSGRNNRFEYCWSFGNGRDRDFNDIRGDGNGFKLGQGYNNKPIVIGCLSWKNKSWGFDENGNQLGQTTIYNCTAWDNSGNNFQYYAQPITDIIKNCVSVEGDGGVITSGATDTFNNWNLDITADTNDFVTMDFTANMGPRNADGSLPYSDFLRLKSTSDLIDKGTDVGLPYIGSAPDLGAYECDEVGTSVSMEQQDQRITCFSYPNPFSDNGTVFKYSVNNESHVTLEIYNIIDHKVKELINTRQPKGSYMIRWDGTDASNSKVPAGMYIIFLRVGDQYATYKVVKR